MQLHPSQSVQPSRPYISPATIQILVVSADRELYVSLAQAGYKAISANHPEKALAQFKKHSIDLVLIDTSTASGDGVLLCQQLRRFSDVPIILLAAHHQTDTVVQGLEAGADDALAQPFTSLEFVARVHALLRRQRWMEDMTGTRNGLQSKAQTVDWEVPHQVYMQQIAAQLTFATGD